MYTHASSSMKSRRQAVILELIDREPLHSQEVLRRRLHQKGFDATQATISRDISELGLVKRSGDGAYQRPGARRRGARQTPQGLFVGVTFFRSPMDRIVLAYSGGLDTSAAIPWLADTYAAEVITVTVDLGQGRELEEVRDRALATGALRAHVLDERDAFAR